MRVSARRALVLVQAMDYTEKNIAPYREFIFSIPVHHSRRADVPFLSSALWERLPGHGAYITHIAVNDESSRLIGREVLGLPKFLAQFDLTTTETERVAEVSADGEPIFTLAVTKRPRTSYKEQRRQFHCY
ncbi:acetoacetate decarboxylase family protein [Streptomyces sp. NBC_01236]|uniref:acetoacetate decarboxylase family protein n=1 Tax=Streptomyces sp. NBC_01236 TaxID=2903789 RepID=UPI002E15DED0|nr:acetoacetate decarboxylase family protein [Streptomyces sp. NBC_01236]